jgi:hypothetical protein
VDNRSLSLNGDTSAYMFCSEGQIRRPLHFPARNFLNRTSLWAVREYEQQTPEICV